MPKIKKMKMEGRPNMTLAIAQVFESIAQLGNPKGSLLIEIESYLLGRYEACFPDQIQFRKQIIQAIDRAIRQHILEIVDGRVKLSLQHPVPIGTGLPEAEQDANDYFERDTNILEDEAQEKMNLQKALENLNALVSPPGSPNPHTEPLLANNMTSICDLVSSGKAVFM